MTAGVTEYVPEAFGEPCGPEDAFWSPGDGQLDPGPIAARLTADLEEFAHLKMGEASVLFLMRSDEKLKAGRHVLGLMSLVRFQGDLGPVGEWMLARLCGGLPDYVMVLDAKWWAQAAPMQREALVYHELLHAEHARGRDGELRFTADGLPVWGIVGHDVEEFHKVAARYGAWSPDIQAFIGALQAGNAI